MYNTMKINHIQNGLRLKNYNEKRVTSLMMVYTLYERKIRN